MGCQTKVSTKAKEQKGYAERCLKASPVTGIRRAVVALVVESPEGGVRSTVSGVGSGLRQAFADTPMAHSFGDITAVPTLFSFDRT